MIINDHLDKDIFAANVRSLAAQIQNTLAVAKAIQDTYLARGWNPTGADPIVDGDLINSKITADQIKAFLESAWLLTRIQTLMAEGVVSGTIQGNVILNNIRADV
jgi:hypothetical protein